jgi:RNase adaptor protein for sRNA GlmZ degradation
MLQEDYIQESESLNLPDNGDRALNYDFQQELEQLASLLAEGMKVPLTDLVIVDAALIVERLEALHKHFPIALATAREIIDREQQIITEAENYAHNLVNTAELHASEIIEESAIIHQAELKATAIKLEAEKAAKSLQEKTRVEIEYWRALAMDECRDIQSGANKYADRVLDNLEGQLQDILNVIQQSRNS